MDRLIVKPQVSTAMGIIPFPITQTACIPIVQLSDLFNISKILFSIKYFILRQPNFLSIRTHQEIPYNPVLETRQKKVAGHGKSLANMTSGYYYNQLFHIYSGGNWMLYIIDLWGVNKTIHQSVKTSEFDCSIDVNIIPTSSFGGT